MGSCVICTSSVRLFKFSCQIWRFLAVSSETVDYFCDLAFEMKLSSKSTCARDICSTLPLLRMIYSFEGKSPMFGTFHHLRVECLIILINISIGYQVGTYPWSTHFQEYTPTFWCHICHHVEYGTHELKPSVKPINDGTLLSTIHIS